MATLGGSPSSNVEPTATGLHPEDERRFGRHHRIGPYAGATVGYLVLSVVVWWHVWTGHPSSTTICGCGDPSEFQWFLAWPAYAISHGINPFYSTAQFYPHGLNLLANTSVLGYGVPLAPITWIFGPIATFNVALTLSPVLSGLAMFALLRHWTSWSPAAFVGGLFYGFSPYVVASLTQGHLNLGMLAFPPLLILCLDKLLIGQESRPVVVGAVLGVLVAVQFFFGTELLLMTLIGSVAAVAAIVVITLVRDPPAVGRRIRPALVGLGTAGAVSVVLLAYPVWFVFAGPGHLSGPIRTTFVDNIGASIRDLFVAAGADNAHSPPSFIFGYSLNHLIGGYQGPVLSSEFLGWGAALVLLLGLIVWRRDGRLWLFGVGAVVSAFLAQAVQPHTWTPWRLFEHLPLLYDVVPLHTLAITTLCVAVMLGLVLDHTRTSLRARARPVADGREPAGWRIGPSGALPPWMGAAAALILAAVAVVPPAVYLAQELPLAVEPVVLPTWFTTVAPRLPAHQVLLVLPAVWSGRQSALTWQAVNTMSYSMMGGGGPEADPSRLGAELQGFTWIAHVSYTDDPYEAVTGRDTQSVHRALSKLGVTKIVLPDESGMPVYDDVLSVPGAAAIITESTGELPTFQSGAWVWDTTALPPGHPDPWSVTVKCLRGLPGRAILAVTSATRCVLSGGTGA
jgi:hypothetical protein